MHAVATVVSALLMPVTAFFSLHTPAHTAVPVITATTTSNVPAGSVYLPIYVYHLVRPARVGDVGTLLPFVVTASAFDTQMAYLANNGYHAISFKELEDYFDHGTPLPPKSVIISFDDSWENQYQYALPILLRYHEAATFFVITGSVGHPYHLTWNQIREMVKDGMTIGDHTRTHQYLTTQTPEQFAREVVDAKRVLEEETGQPVNELAYPFGNYNDAIIAQVKAAGFRSARAFSYGITHDASQRYALTIVRGTDSLGEFVKQLPK